MSTNDEVIYLDCDGERRRYVAHLPPGFTPARPCSAVLMLDGRGGTPWTAMKSTDWRAKADAEHFLAIFPEAMRLRPGAPMHYLDNPQMWNAGPGGSDAERTGPDDVAFLRAVLGDLRMRFNVDARRLFMTGFSNGAAMTFRFAMAEPDLVAAIAPVAGTCRVTATALSRPVPALTMFGKLDPLTPFDGGLIDLPWGGREQRPAARVSVLAWSRLLGLGDEPTDVREDNGVTVERFGPDPSGTEVVCYAIHDLGHVWPGGHRLLPEKLVGPTSDRVRATDVIWAFFQQHPLP